jgi:hypothetical protein
MPDPSERPGSAGDSLLWIIVVGLEDQKAEPVGPVRTSEVHAVRPGSGRGAVAAAWHDRGVTTIADATDSLGTSRMRDIVPAPVVARAAPDQDFRVMPSTRILAPGEAATVGEYLAEVLRPATGFPLAGWRRWPPEGALVLSLEPDRGEAGAYRLTVAASGVRITAGTSAGLTLGVQTLRQLLPAAVCGQETGPGPWDISGGEVVDRPRFAQRGAMLDVSRRFFTVAQVKRFVVLIAQYKVNVLHLHLTDDQGWRLEITSWPDLTRIGGASQIGGGPGGFYTQAQYRDLVAYAASRHVTVIPEIDIPGHVNAALVAYPKLSADGIAPQQILVSGSAVGFSSLSTDREITYRFVDDVLGEVAALTPGPYLHIGADEAHATPEREAPVEDVVVVMVGHGRIVTASTVRPQGVGCASPVWAGRGTEGDRSGSGPRCRRRALVPLRRADNGQANTLLKTVELRRTVMPTRSYRDRAPVLECVHSVQLR